MMIKFYIKNFVKYILVGDFWIKGKDRKFCRVFVYFMDFM